MIEKQARGLSPTKLLAILSVSIALLFILSASGFWFFRNQLVAYAEQVNKTATDANISANDVAKLEKLQTQLKDDAVAVTRAKNIVADSQSYQYQNQIITDLNTYAKTSNVNIVSYDFTNAETGGTGNTPSSTPASPQALTPTGLKTTSVSVSIKNPVDYKSIMKFIHSIEMNLTKMQLSGVSMTRSTDSSKVTVNPLTIEVYIR